MSPYAINLILSILFVVVLALIIIYLAGPKVAALDLEGYRLTRLITGGVAIVWILLMAFKVLAPVFSFG